MEYIRGQELLQYSNDMHRQLQRDSGQIDEVKIKKLVRELIEVMIWLHDRDIVHRDIKLESKS
jgi:serine/threonine protein kinase